MTKQLQQVTYHGKGEIDHVNYPLRLKNKTIAEIKFIINDCKEVFEVWPDHPSSSYYLDEINYCVNELNRRGASL